MNKALLLCVCSLAMVVQAWAVPAKRISRTITQSDGTTLSITLCGDEHFHCFATTDGLPLMEQADGSFAYALVDAAGAMASTGILAHEPQERTADEAAFLSANGSAILTAVAQLRKERMATKDALIAQRAGKRRTASKASAYAGAKRGIVILVNYSDRGMAEDDPQAAFDAQFNTVGYSERGHIGSVHDYFLDQSYGQLDWQFDVAGPYTLSNTLAYYGTNDGTGNDQHLGEMIAEACALADGDVDFSQYDWDGDGEVDQVFVIYAGYGENAGASSNTVWPCMWDLASSDYGGSLSLDGVAINTFACSCELAGTSGTTMDGIGVACHEFSHCLGLPDLYNTSSLSSCFGMGTWSILDSGNYLGPNGNGEVPCAYTGYERMFAGWLEPTVLSSGAVVEEMKPITDGDPNDVYIIYNEGHDDEYYILENRQQEAWDAYAYGHGMLVVHVDYVASYWEANTVNNYSTHQCCTIIPADNDATYTTTSLAGDPYPGTSGNTSLTDTSTPAASLYNANSDGTYYLGHPITDIVESDDGNISFVFDNGIDAPIALEATDINATSFTANWQAVDGAESYTLLLSEVSDAESGLVVSEDFSGFASLTNTSINYASSVDKYLATTGWTASRLYSGYADGTFQGVRLGSASNTGSLATPLYDAPSSGQVTALVACTTYPDEEAIALTLSVLDADGYTLGTLDITEDGTHVLTVGDVAASYQVQIATSSPTRALISQVAVYDGAFSLDELESEGSSGTTTLTGLSGTSHTLTDLTGRQYSYSVQAVRGVYQSAWSDAVYVSLASSSSIEQVSEALHAGDAVQVHALTGLLLRTATLANWSDGLPHGTYILRTGDRAIKVAR